MADLLMGRRFGLWNRAAREESVRDRSCVEQIEKRGEAGLTASICGRHVDYSNGFPIGPACRNERAASVRMHHQQHRNAAALYGANNLQRAPLKRVSRTSDRHKTRYVAEMGSV